MSDLQNQIIALRRQVSLLENNGVVFNVEPKNPGPQTIWVQTTTGQAKYWDGKNWVISGGSISDWNTNVTFSAADYRTISWGAGTMSIGTSDSKTDYAISSGNFTMTQTTYFYWQSDVPTAIQTTTTAGNVVTSGGILIAVGRMNPDTTSNASLKVFGGPSVDQIIADEIVANSISANKISTLNMTGKSCTFDTGTVGGWTMGATNLSATSAGNTTTLSSGATAFSAGPTGSPTVTITQSGVLTATGAIINGYNVTSQGTFGGNGADGAVPGTANLTITGSNDTVIIKNYTSWAAGTATRFFTSTPTGCILYIKISGNADFTNWSFAMSGKGTAGGTGSISGNSPGGTSLFGITGGQSGTLNRGGGGGASSIANGTAASGGPAGGTGLSPFFSSSLLSLLKQLKIDVGTGGGGGVGSLGTGGNGGAGGGCVIFEISGNITLGSCVFNVSGTNGSNGQSSTTAGGGGGGGGGSILVLYNGTLTGTSTDTLTGGTGGTDGVGSASGGAGASGTAVKMKNTVFS